MPTTEVLLTHKDRESGSLLAELCQSEEFLASHVLRGPGAGGAENAKEVGTGRDNRGKAKQFTTVNGRTVVVKESFVYSNKGGSATTTGGKRTITDGRSRISKSQSSPAVDRRTLLSR